MGSHDIGIQETNNTSSRYHALLVICETKINQKENKSSESTYIELTVLVGQLDCI